MAIPVAILSDVTHGSLLPAWKRGEGKGQKTRKPHGIPWARKDSFKAASVGESVAFAAKIRHSCYGRISYPKMLVFKYATCNFEYFRFFLSVCLPLFLSAV